MRIILLIFSAIFLFSCSTKSNYESDRREIIRILNQQQEDWNKNDLKGFMEGYWNSDSLYFYSGSKLKSGWQSTLESYIKKYPDTSATGNLKFDIAKIAEINTDSYFVMGEYHLTRAIGNAHGTFMIIFKRINGQLKIIADSSC
jgi:hypothetical protein